MDTDDLEPLREKPTAADLETLSVDELQAYIADLEAEIDRIRLAIAEKSDHKNAAEQFFKK